MDTGLLILRLVVGVALVGHGTQKPFGWFGGHGRRGTGAFFELLGYRPGVLFAVIAGLSETGGGTLLALGLLTPLAGATIVGVMLNAAWALRERGPWVTNGGWEYPVVLATVGASVALTGPGSVSVDNALSLEWSTGWGVAGVALGVGAAFLMLSAAVVGWARARRTDLTALQCALVVRDAGGSGFGSAGRTAWIRTAAVGPGRLLRRPAPTRRQRPSRSGRSASSTLALRGTACRGRRPPRPAGLDRFPYGPRSSAGGRAHSGCSTPAVGARSTIATRRGA